MFNILYIIQNLVLATEYVSVFWGVSFRSNIDIFMYGEEEEAVVCLTLQTGNNRFNLPVTNSTQLSK